MASGDWQSGKNYVMNVLNSATQPPAYFWKHYGDANNDNGGVMGLHAGDYNLRYGRDALWGQSTTGRIVGTGDIDSLWAPPNMVVHANGCDGHRCESANSPQVAYKGTESSTGTDGLFWPIPSPMGINHIGVLNIRQTDDADETDPTGQALVGYPWQRVLQKCCLGLLDTCGSKFDGPSGSGCAAVFPTCTGGDLITPSGKLPSLQAQHCKAKCKGDLQGCDVLKRSYCDDNPTAPACSCMQMTKTDDYKAWAKQFAKSFPSIPVSPLMYAASDGTNACRDNIGDDLNNYFVPYALTLSIGHLPESYNISQLIVSGDNNQVDATQTQTNNNIKTIQTTNQTANQTSNPVGNPADPPTKLPAGEPNEPGNQEGQSQNQPISTSVLYIILVVIVVCVFAAAFFGIRALYRRDDQPGLNEPRQTIDQPGLNNIQPNLTTERPSLRQPGYDNVIFHQQGETLTPESVASSLNTTSPTADEGTSPMANEGSSSPMVEGSPINETYG
jgi:hypothetical protein